MPIILVVDDSAVDRSLVGGFLRKRVECTVEFAANGVEALARMKDLEPDLIITDLTMPVMDGLEFVTAARSHYPDVPVILMTAHGSESLATEALEKGAASYVPKSRLAEKLFDTIDEVLSVAAAARGHDQLIRCLETTRFVFSLENDPALIDPLLKLVEQMVAGMGLCEFTGRLQIGVALKEALLNALFHGNLEISHEDTAQVQDILIKENDVSPVERRRNEIPYCDRRIRVEILLSSQEARITIRDDGSGFDVSAIPDTTEAGTLESDEGRGLALMRSFTDELNFNDVGNEVTMVKRADLLECHDEVGEG